jgi:predicted DsbA family dithiol-disulfide isomerase
VKAIAALDGKHEVRVRWLPFQMNPAMPKEGISRKEYRTKKFGSWQRSLELDATLVAAGEKEGLRFDFEKIERTPNTLDAHRVIDLAEQQGIQDAVVETLFRAYFTEGRDIGNRTVLLDVAADAGLDRRRAESVLDGNGGLAALQQAGELGRRFGVDGVPFFIINGNIPLSGAQLPEAFLQAFNQALASRP